ncbi:peptidoglycan bridge formation glycyltransferase FemA/FemB family protein, partial [Streptomyces sp. 12297]
MCALLVTSTRPSREGELKVRSLTLPEYRAFLAEHRQASFLQYPSWAEVKDQWRSERVGWHLPTGETAGAALVLYRQFPGTRKYFAYLPEGPVADWSDPAIDRWLDPLLRHLRAAGAFAVRIGPTPAYRRWDAATVKAATGPGRQLSDVLATEV